MVPKPQQIKEARQKAGMTRQQAAETVKSARRTWQDWERGVADMHPGLWVLFQKMTSKGNKMEIREETANNSIDAAVEALKRAIEDSKAAGYGTMMTDILETALKEAAYVQSETSGYYS